MKKLLFRFTASIILVVACGLAASAQITTAGMISGVVTDPNGAVVANATIAVKNNATGAETTTQTADNGTYNVPALPVGKYTVVVSGANFKQAKITGVTVEAGKPSNINVALEIGAPTEQVTVVAGGAELINTTNANVSNTISGRQIIDLPYASRNALDVVLFLPGTQTIGRPRASSINGLPKSAINITIDGINVQDNVLKGSDGFFTYIQPKTDAIEEVTLSTATPGAESSAEGAVQVKFTTRSGSNEFHGSGYVYHRNPFFNANFWYNNRDLAADPVDHKAPRTRQLLTQPGFRIGGPIIIPKIFNGRDKAFFFVNYEEYRLPERQIRTRNIFTPSAASGVFTYVAGGQTRTVNLLTLAASKGFTGDQATLDPTVAALEAKILASTSIGGVSSTSDPNVNTFTFINPGGQLRRFPTVRLDVNLTKKHHVEAIYNYAKFNSSVDFLNNVDSTYPGFPQASQISNRFSLSTALRSTLTQNVVNEARFGLTGGTVVFFPEIGPGQFADQRGFSLSFANAGGPGVLLNGVTNSRFPQRRNAPVKQFADTLTYVRGTHSFNFGVTFSQISTFLQAANGGVVPLVTFGAVDVNDPIHGLFVAANFPGGPAQSVLDQAEANLRFLTGRVQTISGAAYLDESGKNYGFLNTSTERYRQRELGFFVQDAWRFRSNLTLNFGLRYELQYAPVAQNNALSQTSYAGLFGRSGPSGLFVPGAAGGTPTQFTPLPPGQHLYNTDKNNFAPSFGFAYVPDWKKGLIGRLFGGTGQTVIRGGWSMAFNRDGLNLTSSIVGANAGFSVDASRNSSNAPGSTLVPGTLLRSLPNPYVPPAFPASPTFPITPSVFDAANAFTPNLKTPYAISFTGGIQRELNKDMVLEVRYVGTRSHALFRQVNINEINLVENGFINEFKLAQQNILANVSHGCGSTFRYFGAAPTGANAACTGTVPLPTILHYFSGAVDPNNAANYGSSLFANSTFTSRLTPGNPLPQGTTGFASVLNDPRNGLTGNAAASAPGIAGLPANFFIVNPEVAVGGSFLVENSGQSWYDGLTIELRRRLAQGLLVQGSYTFSKGQTNAYVSSAIAFSQPRTLRNEALDKTFSPFDIRHNFKLNYIYELPFGRGQKYLGGIGKMANMLAGGWVFNGTTRWQSGAPFNFGNVQLVGLTRKDLQRAIEIRKLPNKQVFWLADDIVLNTRRAFNTVAPAANTAANPFASQGYSALGVPTGRYVAPGGNNCPQAFAAQCGFGNLVLHGPRFVRIDMSVAKKFKFTENTNLELRVEALNAINNINFKIGSFQNDVITVGDAAVPTFSSTLFGQLNSPDTAYRDVSTTNDPGGRLIQFVVRFNF